MVGLVVLANNYSECKMTELLNLLENNLRTLMRQYKSGQHILIVECLDAVQELRLLTSVAPDAAFCKCNRPAQWHGSDSTTCAKCDKPLRM